MTHRDDEPGDDEPPVWGEALAKYADQFGGTPHLDDYTDRCLMAQLLEEVIREQITRSIVRTFRAATKRIEATTRALDEEWRR